MCMCVRSPHEPNLINLINKSNIFQRMEIKDTSPLQVEHQIANECVCVCGNNACQSSSQEAWLLKAGGKINRADVQTRLTECPSELNTTLMTHTHIHVCVCVSASSHLCVHNRSNNRRWIRWFNTSGTLFKSHTCIRTNNSLGLDQ